MCTESLSGHASVAKSLSNVPSTRTSLQERYSCAAGIQSKVLPCQLVEARNLVPPFAQHKFREGSRPAEEFGRQPLPTAVLNRV